VRDFFRNPAKAYFQVSQGGKVRLVHGAVPEPDEHHGASRRRGQPEKRITSITDRDINAYGWKGDDGCSSSRTSGGNENFHLYVGRPRRDEADGPDADAEGPRQSRGRAARQPDRRPRRDEPAGLDGVRRLPRERGDGRHDDDRSQPGNITGWVPTTTGASAAR
jgi:hypothetical protein